jgi:hypothetical protein
VVKIAIVGEGNENQEIENEGKNKIMRRKMKIFQKIR